MPKIENANNKVDIAINIFAKPYRTALSLLSLLDKSGQHINKLWLQYEPVGIKYDEFNPYLIVNYLKEHDIACEISQPDEWLGRQALTHAQLKDKTSRAAVRYGNAFENSEANYLFLMHNDVIIFKDIISALVNEIGDAFAIGQLGQCWNCPASHLSITQKVMGCANCTPDTYQDFKPTLSQLQQLYKEAEGQSIFKRPYDKEGFRGEFSDQPWPLPECRINEWACLINLKKVRERCIPHGIAWPPGVYRTCAGHNLDIGVPFFRDLHALGMTAKNFKVKDYLKHWVGTGNNTPMRYAKMEDEAKSIITKLYPQFLEWAKYK